MRYEVKFENCVKDKNNFTAFLSWTKIYFILEDKIPKNLVIYLNIFFAKADTEKHRHASAKVLNPALVKLTDWIIENDHVSFVWCFSVTDLNMAIQAMLFDSPLWLIIFQLVVANKKTLFTAKSARIKISC